MIPRPLLTEMPAATGREPFNFGFQPVRVRALRQMLGVAGLNRKLTTLVAPIGYGKTVLMRLAHAELLRAGKQCVWYALDDRDIGLDTLLSAISAQLDAPSSLQYGIGALLGTDISIDQRIEAVVHRIQNYPLPVSIFLDNINFCGDPALGRLLDRLCFGTTSRVQLVLSSVSALPINTARAELEGLLLPLGQSDLRFDASEVEILLGEVLAERVGREGIAEIVRRTEGWPAATRMVQIILERAGNVEATLAGLSGSHEMLASLLTRHVLSQFTPEMMAFMLGVGLLRSFCAELCQDIWPESQARGYLRTLLKRNILVVPLDQNNNWYRLHGLLKDFLVAEAERLLPLERRREILSAASRWSEGRGLWRDAIHYALLCGAVDDAQRILDMHAEEAVRDRGDIALLLDWVDAFEKLDRPVAPLTEYWHVWALAFRRQYDAARRRLDRLQARLLDEGGAWDPPAIRKLNRDLSLLRASIDSLADRSEDAQAEARAWLAELGAHDDPFETSAAHCIVGCANLALHRFVEARQAIQSAQEPAFQTQSAYVRAWVSTYASLIPIAEGNYAEAYAGLITAIKRTRMELAEDDGVGGALAMGAAKCAVEMGLDSEARELLASGLDSLRTHGFLEVAACGLNAAVAIWDGSAGGAYNHAALQEIANAYPSRLSRMLSCFVARRFIELGAIDAAVNEAAQIGIDIDQGSDWNSQTGPQSLPQMNDILILTHAELLVALRRHADAKAAIKEGMAQARRQHRMGKLVSWNLLRAKVALGEQQVDIARGSLIEAIRTAAHRRIIRPFHSHRTAIIQLVSESRIDQSAFALESERAFFSEICEMLWAADMGSHIRMDLKPQLVDNLTTRELDLLRLVALGLTNNQIASRFDISLTTVKWHMQNIFGKMNVSNRSSAIAHARLLNLIN